MIRPLRKRHRIIFPILAVVLPVVYILSLAYREYFPFQDGTVSTHNQPIDKFDRTGTIMKVADVDVAVKLQPQADGHTQLVLTPAAPVGIPNLLVYQTNGNQEMDSWMQQAILLGSFGGNFAQQFELQGKSPQQDQIIIYSLINHEVVGSLKLSNP